MIYEFNMHLSNTLFIRLIFNDFRSDYYKYILNDVTYDLVSVMGSHGQCTQRTLMR